MDDDLEQAYFCIRLALLGEVSEDLRAVSFNVKNQGVTDSQPLLLQIKYYYDKDQAEEFIEDLRCVTTEATACFLSHGEEEFIHLESSTPLPLDSHYAYLRYEKKQTEFIRKHFSYREFNTRNLLVVVGESLLGRASSELVYVYCDIRDNDSILYLRFYHFETISSEIQERWHYAMQEVSEAFKTFPHELDGKILHADKIPKEDKATQNARCVYCKQGISIKNIEK